MPIDLVIDEREGGGVSTGNSKTPNSTDGTGMDPHSPQDQVSALNLYSSIGLLVRYEDLRS
jgi:hypothetical protein